VPQLILGMIEQQRGDTTDARQALGNAMRTYNWNVIQATDANAWMSYAIRSELEVLLYPWATTTRP
jgi:hypothetical protein